LKIYIIVTKKEPIHRQGQELPLVIVVKTVLIGKSLEHVWVFN